MPKNCSSSANILKLQSIEEQQQNILNNFSLIDRLGGRREIIKVNSDKDNLICSKSCEIKYMGDRPSVKKLKYLIDNSKNYQ